MSNANARIKILKELIELESARAKLNAKALALQGKLKEFKDEPSLVAAVEAAGAGKRRGALREGILNALSAAGPKGVSVKELVELLKSKPANIHSWFSTNLPKVAGLKKVGEARYAYVSGSKTEKVATKVAKAPAKAAKAPKAGKAPKASKTAPAKATLAKAAPAKAKKVAPTKAKKAAGFKPAKRGELKAAVIRELKRAGSEGISVADLAELTQTRYKNLYIWFVTTGKRIEGIERVGPARYRLVG